MGWSCVTRSVISGFIVAIGMALTLPYLAFGATRSFGSPGRFRGSALQRHHFVPRPFTPFGFVGVGGFGGDQVIIIQQLPPVPTAEPSRPAENRIYVPPQWVDGGYGVEVLKPGYWTDSK
jgi:hypothetical protein